ncbi:hypothetical protein [Arenimonas sp.]|uniref:hypothetical protein n=1 Tax=Arenimonas sp. TaxID=1872635 RepID=UPI0039E4C231
MSRSRYHIPDEPKPSGLAHLAVDPMWPLFAQMLAGSWLGLPWFLLNSLALGSPTRNREILWMLFCVFGTLGLYFAYMHVVDQELLGVTARRIAVLSFVVLKLIVGYVLYLKQSRVFEIWTYYGGQARNGVIVLMVGAFIGRAFVLDAAANYFVLMIILA